MNDKTAFDLEIDANMDRPRIMCHLNHTEMLWFVDLMPLSTCRMLRHVAGQRLELVRWRLGCAENFTSCKFALEILYQAPAIKRIRTASTAFPWTTKQSFDQFFHRCRLGNSSG